MLELPDLSQITAIHIPDRFHLNVGKNGLTIQQLANGTTSYVDVEIRAYRPVRGRCRRVVAKLQDESELMLEFARYTDDYSNQFAGIVRMYEPVIRGQTLDYQRAEFREDVTSFRGAKQRYESVRDAWRNGIRYREELFGKDGEVEEPGLRQPQIGALHAIAAHWTLTQDKALVVMPTGTGKTEVMMASAVAANSDRLLVVVPSDALRLQTARKFQRYGMLPRLGVLDDIPYPVVGMLATAPTRGHLARIRACNVVVTTMASIGKAPDKMQEAFASEFSHIYFDEAHHIQATTWKKFQQRAKTASTLLLTATPFREDGKHIEGKIIYDYPLSTALDRGYFKPVCSLKYIQRSLARQGKSCEI